MDTAGSEPKTGAMLVQDENADKMLLICVLPHPCLDINNVSTPRGGPKNNIKDGTLIISLESEALAGNGSHQSA
ncbi:MAG: hypothetical protein MUO76_15665 [Anaerolineaceae bacterium]|nr:hypothetical protein [Anaerolineaceae bacterium]